MSWRPDTTGAALVRGDVALGDDGLVINRRWTDGEFRNLQARIDAARSLNYQHHIAITDRAGHTLTTPGPHLTHRTMPLFEQAGFPRDLSGKSVLDIGCNAGFYSTSAWLRGAHRVVGIDRRPHYINQALLVREVLGLTSSDIEFRVGDGHDLTADADAFDVVINTGVVYHLQNPMDFLTKIARLTRELMFLESEMLIDPALSDYAWFIEGEYVGDGGNWWIYGPGCLAGMARAAGFREATFSGFIWKPEPGTTTPEGTLRQGRGVLICRK
jgi:tRNA (mo5U34)-methyltransferase